MTDARPILFSGEMVRGLLAGRKYQTRRIVQHEGIVRVTDRAEFLSHSPYPLNPGPTPRTLYVARDCGDVVGLRCPYGKPGDLLWVRETWQQVHQRPNGQRHTEARANTRYLRSWIEYAASSDYPPPVWRPSIHMFRRFSRLTLIITSTRIEQLNGISPEDAAAEGWPGPDAQNTIRSSYPIAWYAGIWEGIHGRNSWEANPWVWVICFTVERCNVDKVLERAA